MLNYEQRAATDVAARFLFQNCHLTEQKIAQLEKRARIEKQPRKKWELVSEIRRLEKEL